MASIRFNLFPSMDSGSATFLLTHGVLDVDAASSPIRKVIVLVFKII